MRLLDCMILHITTFSDTSIDLSESNYSTTNIISIIPDIRLYQYFNLGIDISFYRDSSYFLLNGRITNEATWNCKNRTVAKLHFRRRGKTVNN